MIRPMVNGQGASQQTAAAQMVLGRLVGAKSGPRRRARTANRRKAVPVRRARAAGRRSKKAARLVKGSAAAKRYMASIRRKRRR